MPSLFSRSSTPKKQQGQSDEFGRIDSASSQRRTCAPGVADGSFLPLSIDRPRPGSHDYGYLAYERQVVLPLEDVSRLVIVVCDELGARGGVTTPFIFSTTALDISSSGIRRLISAFLGTCTDGGEDAEGRWRDEARFAGAHELGMCLRWGLGRAVRTVGGQAVRGLVGWERYVEFRDSEVAQGYPRGHFGALLRALDVTLQTVLVTLLTLLSRLTAHSTRSGHTPPTLSPLFGPLLFGLGPAGLAFHHTYAHYLRAVHAMEHLQLAFIRWQDATTAPSLGLPVRLREWIAAYPAMLPDPAAPPRHKPQPRPGARTVRLTTVRRNVRMYSPDLVRSAASWAESPKHGLASSSEWARIAPPALRLPPRYADPYRKRMLLPPHVHPHAPPLAPASSSSSYTPSTSTASDSDYFALDAPTPDDRFRSLSDLKWGQFESMGFAAIEDEKKLQFDLSEAARTDRSAKRDSLNWADFSSAGFSRGDAPLSATLQFSTPVATTISAWPVHNAEIDRKLKNTQRALPPFGWDTEPVVVGEEIIEEAFLDVFCDLIYGGGWMDLERAEEVHRDCNWALVEFKSLPANRSTASGGSDPRTSTSLMLFEEFVPLEYRQQLAATPSARRRPRLPSLFSSPKPKWKQAPTLNGRPYVVGHVPHSPTYREVEFEEILRAGAGTKVISLGSRASVKVPPPEVPVVSKAPAKPPIISGPLYVPPPPPPPPSDETHSDEAKSKPPSVASSTKRAAARFRLPGGMMPGPSPGAARKAAKTGGECGVDFEFETRLAGWSDEGEAWVDILVKAEREERDPDAASREVERVLAGVRERVPSVVSERVDRDPEGGLDHLHGAGAQGDEVLRTSEESEYTNTNEDEGPAPARFLEDKKSQRRMGYFDVHPERRPNGHAGLAYDAEHKGAAQLPVPPPLGHAAKVDADDARLAYDVEDAGAAPPPPPPPPPPVIRIEPFVPEPQDVEPSCTPEPQKAVPMSKTAALIEMYRERERGSSPKPKPKPKPVNVAPSSPAPAPPLLAAPVPKVAVGPGFEPSPPPREEPGRASPARYVHGAPLHNVLEEEEEE